MHTPSPLWVYSHAARKGLLGGRRLSCAAVVLYDCRQPCNLEAIGTFCASITLLSMQHVPVIRKPNVHFSLVSNYAGILGRHCMRASGRRTPSIVSHVGGSWYSYVFEFSERPTCTSGLGGQPRMGWRKFSIPDGDLARCSEVQ